MKAIVNEGCIGCGLCASTCPAVFTLEDGVAVAMAGDIPEEELPFVKQKFYKGSSKARGSGIGLAVCDEIVRLHGGTFDIANAEGGGAVVTICIPEKE